VKRPAPEPFHPPVGLSDEAFPVRRRWLALAFAILATLAAGAVLALTLPGS